MPEILSIPTASIPSEWLPTRGSLLPDKTILRRIESLPLHWGERRDLEQDDSYKQLIPYALIRYRKRYACYPRKGSEKRLHALCSCGFGGHVEKTDATANLFSTLRNSLCRELKEECNLSREPDDLRFAGFIHESETPVGRVHWGFVFVIEVEDPKEVCTSSEITELKWIDPADSDIDFEIWTTLALSLCSNPA